ncbi:hypothetical protein HYW94_01865 [Candidatus Uhrbacteria bacterium]|nr:hypothetical protein [Candidatus Uhrbacteria bacterium]
MFPPKAWSQNHENSERRSKKKILDNNTTRYEDIPRSYWNSYEQNIIRATGQLGDWQTMNADQQEQWKRMYVETLLVDQRASLEEWLDYFLSNDSGDIPDALKYWAFRSITQLQEYEKEEGETHIKFPRRSKGSVKKFPDLNHDALRYVVEAMMEKFKGERHEFEYDIQPDERAAFEKFLTSEKFADLYAWACEQHNPIPQELLPVTDGEWRAYPKGSNVEMVAQSLRGRGTGLCIAGRGAAKKYLDTGDLFIYYSKDEEGNPLFPRAAIHVANGKIAEVRGIAYKQNVDGYIADTVQKKLDEFPDGKAYRKKTEDMKRLTEIDKKTKAGTELTDDDLIFLYERDSTIQYFGYKTDPRIKELQGKRNPKEDAPRVLECAPEEIAWGGHELTKNSKAYIGPLFKGIFSDYPNLEHIYTSFPEGKIHELPPLEVVPEQLKTGQGFIDEIEEQEMKVWNKHMLTKGTTPDGKTFDDLMRTRRKELQELGGKETVNLVHLTVNDLFGDNKNHTVKEIFDKGTDLGLELCPPETGPLLRLAIKDQPMDTYWGIAMETITGSDGDPSVFCLSHGVLGVGLDRHWAEPGRGRGPDRVVVFRRRKSEALAA